MRYHVLATDYDGTIAQDGRVDDATLRALEQVRRSGRKLLLVTGRVLEDLAAVFPHLDLFERVVVENGAVVHRPATGESRSLAEAPPERFVRMLRERGVTPLRVGRVIVATWRPQEDAVLDAIRTCGLELQLIFNKGAVMVLPSGANKASGLAAALAELKLSPHNAVGVGDAENDHAFLAACECGVAVANALPALKETAQLVTAGDHGRGVQELARALVETDLSGLAACGASLAVGVRRDGSPVTLNAYGPPVLIAGASGGGKSTLATRLLEELADRSYQICVIDPEGDYVDFSEATVLGDPESAPRAEQVLERLEAPSESCVVNLLGVPLADRPAFFDALLPSLVQLRARTGRPHWIVADEAHHLFPAQWQAGAAAPAELAGFLIITVHPERLSPTLIAAAALVFAVGKGAEEVLARFAAAVGASVPRLAEPPASHESLLWIRRSSSAPELLAFTASPPRAERRRHVRKYAVGELGPDKSFYFRGPAERLNLRARNLQAFVEIGEGVDDDTWRHHLVRGEYSRWFRDVIKDAELATETERIEKDRSLSLAASRAEIRALIERRYTGPS